MTTAPRRVGRSSRRGPHKAPLAIVAMLAIGTALLLVGARQVGGDLMTELRYRQARAKHSKATEGISDSDATAKEVAWLTVSGTPIDYPVAQASEQNPNFYLTHDLWAQPSQIGCPYLDWRCGLSDSHAIVYGHHVGTTNLQFSPIADAWQQDRFNEIGPATLSAPIGTHAYLPCLALKVDKNFELIQRFSLSTDELRAWLAELLNSASASSEQASKLCDRATKALTLATCSSVQAGQRERTLLVFVEVEP